MDLDPLKILVVLVVALIVLGPQRLPQIARRAGEAWHDLQRFRQQLRSEIDGAVGTLRVPTATAAPAATARPTTEAGASSPAAGHLDEQLDEQLN